MNSCVYRKDEFIILQSSKGYVVVNTKGTYNNHSHFNYSLQAAKDCIRLVQKRIIPRKSKYMMVACKRLSLDQEYINTIQDCLDNPKGDYVNYESMMRHDSYKRVHGALRRR